MMVPSLSQLSCESSVSVKENPDRKKNEFKCLSASRYKSGTIILMIFKAMAGFILNFVVTASNSAKNDPACIYLSKVALETPEECVKSV